MDLEEQVKKEEYIEPILYDERTKGFIRIEYARRQKDYIYHIYFRKTPKVPKEQIYYSIGKAIDDKLPKDAYKLLKPPTQLTGQKENFMVECYTLTIEGIANLPGARKRMEEIIVNALLDDLNGLFENAKR